MEDKFAKLAEEPEDKKVVQQLVKSLDDFKFFLGGARLDKGVGVQVLAAFDEQGAAAKELLGGLRPVEPAHLEGLPQERRVAAYARAETGLRTKLLARALADSFLKELFQANRLTSEADRPTLLGIFNEVWSRVRGTRIGLYLTSDEARLGLFSVVAVLDTRDAGEFLTELRTLARIGDGTLDPTKPEGQKELDIAKLVGELSDERYAVRASASRTVDCNLILRSHAAIQLLHGDIMPPPSSAKAKDRNAWAELVDALPPVGHFHKAWSQLVERVDDGTEERWVLLPGFEEKCKTLYDDAQAKGLKLDDDTDAGRVVEKGILTRTREFMVEFMRWKADRKAAEAAAKSEAKEELEDKAKEFESSASCSAAKLEKRRGEHARRGPRSSDGAFAPACCSTDARAAERPAEHAPDTLPVLRLSPVNPAYPILGAPASREAVGAGGRDSATSAEDAAESATQAATERGIVSRQRAQAPVARPRAFLLRPFSPRYGIRECDRKGACATGNTASRRGGIMLLSELSTRMTMSSLPSALTRFALAPPHPPRISTPRHLMTPLPASQALDAFLLEARAKVLDLAAVFDRINRGKDARALTSSEAPSSRSRATKLSVWVYRNSIATGIPAGVSAPRAGSVDAALLLTIFVSLLRNGPPGGPRRPDAAAARYFFLPPLLFPGFVGSASSLRMNPRAKSSSIQALSEAPLSWT
jgi:hypothetical protein